MRRFPTESILIKASFDPFGAFANLNSTYSPIMERRDQGDRKVSFNPEAAAFSPITTAAEQAEDDARAECRFAKSAVPHGMSLEVPGQQCLGNTPADSPLETFKKLRIAASGEASDIDPDRLQLQNLVDKGLPAEALMRSLGGRVSLRRQNLTTDSDRYCHHPGSRHDTSTSARPGPVPLRF